MKRRSILLAAMSSVAMLVTAPEAEAQDSLSVDISGELVSRYIWRGMDVGYGVSLQPTLGLSYKGLSLSASGAASVHDMDLREIDVMLSYEIGGFTATLTDYYSGVDSVSYKDYRRNHTGELQLDYSFEAVPLTLTWATMLWAGEKDELDDEGDRMYSSYFGVSYEADVRGVTLTPAVGITPWEGQYADGFKVMDITLKAEKTVIETERVSVPIYTQTIVSPANKKAYLVLGIRVEL